MQLTPTTGSDRTTLRNWTRQEEGDTNNTMGGGGVKLEITASGFVGEAGELAEGEGGAADADPATLLVLMVVPFLGDGGEVGGSGGAAVAGGGGGGGRREEVGEAVGEREEDGLGNGDERQERRAQPLPHRQRARRLLQIQNPTKQKKEIKHSSKKRQRRRAATGDEQVADPPTHHVVVGEAEAVARLHGCKFNHPCRALLTRLSPSLYIQRRQSPKISSLLPPFIYPK